MWQSVKNLIFLTFLGFLPACGPHPALTPSEPDAIIGNSDLVQIDRSYEDQNLVNAIGSMKIGCTVTHIGGGIAITAGHCLSRGRMIVGRPENQPCRDEKFHISWGRVYGAESMVESVCEKILRIENNPQRDYAILKVHPEPAGTLPLQLASKPKVEAKISIFSYPDERPLEWSNWCLVGRDFPETQKFSYECDTEAGSSGAAILNEKWAIIGIHNYYSQFDGLNGGTRVMDIPWEGIPLPSSGQ